MVIRFLCPNGHKIHCPESLAGQPAKCPACGVRFLVPSAGDEAAVSSQQPPDQADVLPARVASTGSSLLGGLVSGVAAGHATAADEIEFLCPNNHLLHGKAAMQGRPGICPQCQSKFRIPTYDTWEAPRGDAPQQPTFASAALSPPATPYAPMPDSAVPLGQEGLPTALHFGGVAGAETPHPLAALFPRLWAYKSLGASMEIQYGDGNRLIPDRFATALSQGSHGVFAVDDTTGTFTITAVDWAAVHAIVLRNVKKLIDETTR
jgi:hypothetical protein